MALINAPLAPLMLTFLSVLQQWIMRVVTCVIQDTSQQIKHCAMVSVSFYCLNSQSPYPVEQFGYIVRLYKFIIIIFAVDNDGVFNCARQGEYGVCVLCDPGYYVDSGRCLGKYNIHEYIR